MADKMEKLYMAPNRQSFSSGPTVKFRGWYDVYVNAILHNFQCIGRSHRGAPAKKMLLDVIELHKQILGIPKKWRVGIMPGSNTGAIEAFMWNALGKIPVDVFYCGSFGKDWWHDIRNELMIKCREFDAPYGETPDYSKYNKKHDAIIVWNEATSGVKVKDGAWIPEDREGLVIVDATSALFTLEFPWDKVDVVTCSPQKAIGSEAFGGFLALSPRAVSRLESFNPSRALPKIFRILKDGKINEGIFQGSTINTPSMLAVIDCFVCLEWAKNHGLAKLIERVEANYSKIEEWVEKTPWIEFLVKDAEIRSHSSVTLSIVTTEISEEKAKKYVAGIIALLDKERMAHDLKHYRSAPVGFRIWCGPTVTTEDLERLTQCFDWAWTQVS